MRVEQQLPYGPPEKHRDRLERQEKGEVSYVIAWDGDKAIGHALMKWLGAEEAGGVAGRSTPHQALRGGEGKQSLANGAGGGAKDPGSAGKPSDPAGR
ncbi:MAG: hypothetical protein ACP5HS_00860 [Anaerolineae bacterium]